MNLISETHYSCERGEYAYMVLWEYTIISLTIESETLWAHLTVSSHSSPTCQCTVASQFKTVALSAFLKKEYTIISRTVESETL